MEKNAIRMFPTKFAADPRIFDTMEKLSSVTSFDVMCSSRLVPSANPRLYPLKNSSTLLIGSSRLAMISFPSIVDNSCVWLMIRGTKTLKKEMKSPQRTSRVINAANPLGK